MKFFCVVIEFVLKIVFKFKIIYNVFKFWKKKIFWKDGESFIYVVFMRKRFIKCGKGFFNKLYL